MPIREYREKRKESVGSNLFKKLIKKIRTYLSTRIDAGQPLNIPFRLVKQLFQLLRIQ